MPTLYVLSNICGPCLRRLARKETIGVTRRPLFLAAATSSRSAFGKEYFWGNESRKCVSNEENEGASLRRTPKILSTTTETRAHEQNGIREELKDGDQRHHEETSGITLLPHRRRQRRNFEESEKRGNASEQSIPLDASARLATLSSRFPIRTIRSQLLAYLSLSKPRLTFLIVLTTTASYSLFPVAVSPMASSLDLSPLTLLNLTTGTALAGASANALNMLLEPAYDAKMSRTRLRPLVRGLLSSRAALFFAMGTGIAGVALLHYGVNSTTAFLGAANILIYAGIYTPLKRLSILNTWVGAVVGGIPPLMGWTAAAGQATCYADATWRDLLFAADGSSAGGWLLAALLFAWQFPHFWALAYPIRNEYASAGYRMLVSFDVRKTARISLRYSLAMFPICVGLSAVGVTNWAFVPTSSIANSWLVRESWRYLKHEGTNGSARGLFWASVWHLPVMLVLAMIMKNGLWQRVVQGGLDEEELREWQSEDLGSRGVHLHE